MDIEEENENAIEVKKEIIVDPIEVLLPTKPKNNSKNSAKKQPKGRRSSSKSKTPKEEPLQSELNQRAELINFFLNELNSSLNNNLSYFEDLLLAKITNCMQGFQNSDTQISLVVIEDSLQFSLNTLNIDNMLTKLATNHKAFGIRLSEAKCTSLKLILTQIKETLSNYKMKSQKNLILFFDYYLQEESDLFSNIVKYIEEDLLTDRMQNCKVTIVMPSLCPNEPNVDTEIEFSSVKLNSSVSLVSKLLVSLLCDEIFFPILSRSIIRHLLSMYEFYELSFQSLKSRLIIIVQDYLVNLDGKSMIQLLEIASGNKKSTQDCESIKKRIKTMVLLFYEIENLIVHDIEYLDSRFIKLIVDKDQKYTLPNEITSSFQSPEDVLAFAERVGKCVLGNTKDADLRSYGKTLLDLPKQSTQKPSSKRSTSKPDKKNAMAIESNGETKKRKKKDNAEIAIICNSINTILSELFTESITGLFEELQTSFPQFFYADIETLRMSVSPDFTGEIVTYLNGKSRELKHRPGFNQFIESIQEYNVGIDINQCLLTFKQKIEELKDTAANKAIKANSDMLFYLYVSELKYIGLINERGRGKMCFQKDYFAKTFHNISNMNVGEEDEEDCL